MSIPKAPAAVAETSLGDFLRFYDKRGYGYRVGFGTRPAILVIDFSIAFTLGTENFPGGGYDEQVARTRELLDAAREAGDVPILYTTIAYEPHMQDAGHWAAKIPWIKGLQAGTREVEIDERLAPRPDEPVLVKKYPSAFFGTTLDADLKRAGVDTLIICGCTTSACVRATTVDSMQYGYRTILAHDAISDITPALHAVHLADLVSRYADASSTAEIAAVLSKQPIAARA
jgi:nicotinamidase-related amidase